MAVTSPTGLAALRRRSILRGRFKTSGIHSAKGCGPSGGEANFAFRKFFSLSFSPALERRAGGVLSSLSGVHVARAAYTGTGNELGLAGVAGRGFFPSTG